MTTDYTTVDRIIAKIDNDFNPNNSDWIPRVGAWIYDALMQLDCVLTEKVQKQLVVKNRIARSSCELGEKIKVYDSNGCKLVEFDNANICGCGNINNTLHSSTGDREVTPQTITKQINGAITEGSTVAFTENVPVPYPPRYNVVEVKEASVCQRGYVRINSTTFELNYNADFIYVEYNAPKTNKCQFYNCVSPLIPNNGKLIEAITYYCMYKMLTRGYVHPVMNLAASQYGTNPYYIWMQTKEEAKRSVINDGTDEILDDLWRSAFYINTFNPRGKS